MRIRHIAPGRKLFDRCGTESISSSQHNFLSFILITQAEFSGRRGFSCAVDTYHEDDVQVVIFDRKRLLFA